MTLKVIRKMNRRFKKSQWVTDLPVDRIGESENEHGKCDLDDVTFSPDFNSSLSEQSTSASPEACTVMANRAVRTATPSNERLRQLAAENPPPPCWFDEEEQLF